MSAHCDFSEQTQAGDSKPDLIVHLPGDRVIIVDAKVPDLDFLNALDAADSTKRAEALAAHAGKLKATVKALADRDYPSQFPNALDYVVMFLPAESLFSAALEGDHDLIVWAAGKRIMLATPASLIALLRSVSVSWQQHAQTESAQEIAEARTSAHSTGLSSRKMKLSSPRFSSCASERIFCDLACQLIRQETRWLRFRSMSGRWSKTSSTSGSSFLLQRQSRNPLPARSTMNRCNPIKSGGIAMPETPSSPTTPFHRVLSQSRTMTLCGGLSRVWTLRATIVPSAAKNWGV